jgi:thioesterase domain-containing protein
VIAREDAPGEKRLVAYLVCEQGQAPSPSELRGWLLEKLPHYMVPSAFVLLATLSLTPNGKVDRRALPAPDPARPELEAGFSAPRDALEFQLTQIWESVLGTGPIGVRDNFFDLGGHSLLAVRLFGQMEKACGRPLPLATLFQAPTVEQLAALLRQQGWSPPWSSLVAIQPGGSQPPFFCVHAHGGNVVGFRDLADHLGRDQPFYGLQARGLDGQAPGCSRLEEMAAFYLQELRTLQPQGPYYLGGYCFGGHVAFEMAHQLHAQGEPVALLALIGIEAPSAAKQVPMIQALRWHLENLKPLGVGGKLRYVRVRALRKLWHGAVHLWPWGRQGALPPAGRALGRYHTQLSRAYAPRLYRGRLTLFRAVDDRSIYAPDYGWGRWTTGGVEIHEVPGENETLLHEPSVCVLAQRLRACMERAQAECGVRPLPAGVPRGIRHSRESSAPSESMEGSKG